MILDDDTPILEPFALKVRKRRATASPSQSHAWRAKQRRMSPEDWAAHQADDLERRRGFVLKGMMSERGGQFKK